jgi:hypothetical protein
MWDDLSDERTRLSFATAVGPRSHSLVGVPLNPLFQIRDFPFRHRLRLGSDRIENSVQKKRNYYMRVCCSGNFYAEPLPRNDIFDYLAVLAPHVVLIENSAGCLVIS